MCGVHRGWGSTGRPPWVNVVVGRQGVSQPRQAGSLPRHSFSSSCLGVHVVVSPVLPGR